MNRLVAKLSTVAAILAATVLVPAGRDSRGPTAKVATARDGEGVAVFGWLRDELCCRLGREGEMLGLQLRRRAWRWPDGKLVHPRHRKGDLRCDGGLGRLVPRLHARRRRACEVLGLRVRRRAWRRP